MKRLRRLNRIGKHRIEPETRSAIRLSQPLKELPKKHEPLWLRVAAAILSPVLTGIIGLAVGISLNLFQARFQANESMRTWISQHNNEVAEKILTKKMDIMDELQRTISRIFDVDEQIEMVTDVRLAEVALQQYGMKIKLEDVSDVVKLPLGNAILEHRDDYSKLQVLSQDVEIYFDKKTAAEMHKLVSAISNEPVVPIDGGYFLNAFGELKALDRLDLYNIQMVMERPDLRVHHSTIILELLDRIGRDIKLSIRHDVAITYPLLSQ